MNKESSVVSTRSIPLWMAIVPIIVLIVLLVINVRIYSDDASYGPNQIALLLAAAVAAVLGLFLKIDFKSMMKGIVGSLESSMTAMLLLLLIGSLTGTWMISGIVPAMIYYGLDILNPQIFLFASVIVCAIVSVATGSSWSTIATVGVALLGIGDALGISQAMAAGAIISGAYFGDKLSPLSDTTNLAAAMAETDLIGHIKYMLWTTVPSITLTLIIFLVIGYSGDIGGAEAVDTSALKEAIADKFNITPLLFLVPAAVLVMVFFKVDAIAALFVGVILGGIFAIAFQPDVIKQVSGQPTVSKIANDGETEVPAANYLTHSYVAVVNAMALETTAVSGDAVDEWKHERNEVLLTRARAASGNAELTLEEFEKLEELADTPAFYSEMDQSVPEYDSKISAAKLMAGKGMQGMLNTIWLIVTAMCFGGVMEACGFLRRITEPLVRMAKSDGSLVATTAGTCMFVNATASDQYLSIVVPGRMYRESFEERGLDARNLSRTLEDAGTVTSVLVPWNTCGAAQMGVLGVAVMSFAPYCFFNIISPFMTILYAYIGIKIARTASSKSDS